MVFAFAGSLPMARVTQVRLSTDGPPVTLPPQYHGPAEQ